MKGRFYLSFIWQGFILRHGLKLVILLNKLPKITGKTNMPIRGTAKSWRPFFADSSVSVNGIFA